MKRFSLRKEERLIAPSEFKNLIRKGVVKSTEHFDVFTFHNQMERRRLGIKTSKKIGSAVKRNFIKRLLREFFRLHKMHLPTSSDILFVAKPGADRLNYSSLCEELKILLKPDKPL